MTTLLDWNKETLQSQIIKNFNITETGTWRYLFQTVREDRPIWLLWWLSKTINKVKNPPTGWIFKALEMTIKLPENSYVLWILLSQGLVHARPDLNFFIMFFTTIDHSSQCNTIQFSLNHVRKLFQIKFAKDFTFKEQDNLLGLIRCITYCGFYSKVSSPNLVRIDILGEIIKTSWKET